MMQQCRCPDFIPEPGNLCSLHLLPEARLGQGKSLSEQHGSMCPHKERKDRQTVATYDLFSFPTWHCVTLMPAFKLMF